MSKVIHYNELSQFTVEDILILDYKDNEDYEILLEYIKEQTHSPYKIFHFDSNHCNDLDIYLILKYLKEKFKRKEVVHQLNIDRFEKILNLLINNFNIHDFKNFSSIKKIIDVDVKCKIIEIKKVSNFLDNLLNEIFMPFFQQTPFLYKELEQQKAKHWLEYQLEHFTSINEFIKKINNMKKSSYIMNENIDSLETILNNYSNLINKFNNPNTTTENKLFIISAYFYSLAKIFFKKNEYNFSLTFLHRTLDLYFQHIAKKDNILKYETGKLFYTNSNKGEKIYLRATMENLTTARIQEEQKKILHEVNDLRNYSLITHGVYGIKKEKLQEILEESKKLILNIEGNTLWFEYTKYFFSENIINNSIWYLFTPSIETFFQEIKNPAQ